MHKLHFVVIALSMLYGLCGAYEEHRQTQINPPKSPRQQRAQREDCRRKGL